MAVRKLRRPRRGFSFVPRENPWFEPQCRTRLLCALRPYRHQLGINDRLGSNSFSDLSPPAGIFAIRPSATLVNFLPCRGPGGDLKCYVGMKQALFFAAILVVMATSAEATRMYEPQDYRSIVPTDWRLLPPDPGSHERRFVSPLGDAWLSLYAEPVDREPIPAHIERVRNAPGEMITYERREPNWILVSGYKGNRIFYRRATLACENRQWHHIAFEYPATQKLAS